MTGQGRLTTATKRLAAITDGGLGDAIVMARYLIDLSWRARRGLPADDPMLGLLAAKIERWTAFLEEQRGTSFAPLTGA